MCAKRTTPIYDDVLSPLFARIGIAKQYSTGDRIHKLIPATEEWLANAAQLKAEWPIARAAWAALAPWKRFRWSLCAWKNGDHAAEPSAGTGGGGWRLYWQCWLEQGVVEGKQPISPCARRTWDATASQWDYTP